jgi:hypothetical protein
MPRNKEQLADLQRTEHGWCVQLIGSQAFRFYLAELASKHAREHQEVCAEQPRGSREFHAGRLSALTEAMQLIDKRYAALKPLVEVVPE